MGEGKSKEKPNEERDEGKIGKNKWKKTWERRDKKGRRRKTKTRMMGGGTREA